MHYEHKVERTLELAPHQVVLRPLITEKGVHKATRHNRYAFEVHQQATKDDIKAAIEQLFNVKVIGVATQTLIGKARRYKFKNGVTKSWKKAIVKLSAEDKIPLF